MIARCCFATALLAIALASPALAQDPPRPAEEPVVVPPGGEATSATGAATDARDAEGRGLFEAGRAAFADGRYEAAVDYFDRAYALTHRAALLYNIGSANDRLRRDAAALAAFEEYLREVPDAENAREVEARVAVLRRSVDMASASPPPVDDGLTAAERDQLAFEAHAREQAAAAAGPAADGGPGIVGEWWLWTIIGVVVGAGIVTGVVLGTQSSGGTVYPPYVVGDDGVVAFTLTGPLP